MTWCSAAWSGIWKGASPVHDPDVIALEIVRPWPQRSSLFTPRRGDTRWQFLMHHEHHEPYCTEHNCTGNPFPWWKPKSWSRFWVLAGRAYYWPPLVTIWHREPGGRDSGSVCKHTRRVWDEAARKWRYRPMNGWRFHIHHWRVQLPPLQALRRWLLTRCAWCGGPSRKGNRVNNSPSWSGEPSRWWQGEKELLHEDCYMVRAAHLLCLCAVPVLDHAGYGQCAACGKSRAWRQVPGEADRLLAALPQGSRIPADLRPRLEVLWAERRAAREAKA